MYRTVFLSNLLTLPKPKVQLFVCLLFCLPIFLHWNSGLCCVSKCDHNGFLQLICAGYWSNPLAYSGKTFQICTKIKNAISVVCHTMYGKCDIDRSKFCTEEMSDELHNRTHRRTKAAIQKRENLRRWIQDLSNENSSPKLAVFHPCGRLGNWMFQMASLIGIARKNGRIPLPFNGATTQYIPFEGLGIIATKKQKEKEDVSWNPASLQNSSLLREKGTAIFTESVGTLSASMRALDLVAIHGCLQSWKYFAEIQEEIRAIFTFSEKVYERAISQILSGFRKKKWMHQLQSVPVKVGIHVRRGDFLLKGSLAEGLIPAPEEYFSRAVTFIERKLRPSVFFVVSEDYQYCRDLFNDSKFYVVPRRTPEDDMALLQLMDYVIISAGSFGWWGAFLSQAKEVIYYKDWPRPNSSLSLRFPPGDYYLPEWIGIS